MPTKIQETFSANVRKLRKQAKLSQEKLAELSGLHRTYIGGIEQCRINVSIKNVEKIANALDVSVARLFKEEGAEAMAKGTLFAVGARKDLDAESAQLPCGQDGGDVAPAALAGLGALGPASAYPYRPATAEAARASYALISMEGNDMKLHSLDVVYEDLTVQVLCSLVDAGYSGDELLERYREIHDELIAFYARKA